MQGLTPIKMVLFLSSLWVSISSIFTKTTTRFWINTDLYEETGNQPVTVTTVTHNHNTNTKIKTTTKTKTKAKAKANNTFGKIVEQNSLDLIIADDTKEAAKIVENLTVTVIPTISTLYTDSGMPIPKDLVDTKRNANQQNEIIQADKEGWKPLKTMNPSLRREVFRNCTSPEASVPWPFDTTRATQDWAAPKRAFSVLNPHLRCGLGLGGSNSSDQKRVSFIEYFEQTVKQRMIQPILDQEKCHDLVVYGAAFGSSYIEDMTNELEDESNGDAVVNSEDLVRKHGRCFFMFVHQNDIDEEEESENSVEPQQLGHYWLVPLDPIYLPYQNSRRNTKLLKYMGQLAFLSYQEASSFETIQDKQRNSPVSSRAIIWQDAKFFRYSFIHSIPRDYFTVFEPIGQETAPPSRDSNSAAKIPCLTTMGLPATPSAFSQPLTDELSLGLTVSSYSRPRYKDHCQTIIDALDNRPDVTDSPTALTEQCRRYMTYVKDQQKIEGTKENVDDEGGDDEDKETDSLNFGLVDSAFLVWNESTQQCRDFNAILRCTMLDQLQCHSDRDQVLFPLVIHQFLASTGASADNNEENPYSLKAMYYNSWTEMKTNVDKHWKPHAHDLELVSIDDSLHEQPQVFVRIQRSACHWYYFFEAPNQPMGERSCGHKIWLRDSLSRRNPSLDQEKQLTTWANPTSLGNDSDGIGGTGPDTNCEPMFDANATLSSLAGARGNRDKIEAPFAAEFHKCTSTEYETVPYTFRERISKDTERPELFCGTAGKGETISPFHQKLRQTVLDPKIRQLASKEKCSDMVVFGEAFDKDTASMVISTLNGKPNPQFGEQVEQYDTRRSELQSIIHGKCFFLFVLEQDLPSIWEAGDSNLSTLSTLRGTTDNGRVARDTVLAAGHFWVIPVDRNILPYASMRRNSKLFQYSGQFFFPDAKTVVYQNSVFFKSPFLFRQPLDYHSLYLHQNNIDSEDKPCLTVFSLPKIKANVGLVNIKHDEEFFQGYCKHLINKMERLSPDGAPTGEFLDPSGTASFLQQCDAYLQFVYKRELTTGVLDQGLVDTNLMSWDENTEFCRDFNANLRCTILDQLHCHMAQDRLVFPFALYVNQMGLGSTTEYIYTEEDKTRRWPIDNYFEKRRHDLYFLRHVPATQNGAKEDASTTLSRKQDVVKIIREKYHWTKTDLGKAIDRQTAEKIRGKLSNSITS